jgi:hypothetical protein
MVAEGGEDVRIGYRKFVGICPLVPETTSVMWGVDDRYFVLRELVKRGHEVFILSDTDKTSLPYLSTGQQPLFKSDKYIWLEKLVYKPDVRTLEGLDLDGLIIESGPNNVSVAGHSRVKVKLRTDEENEVKIETLFNRYASRYGMSHSDGHDIVVPKSHIRVRSLNGWSKVEKIIRHKYTGLMCKISYLGNSCVVTANHSLIVYVSGDYQLATPTNLNGKKLVVANGDNGVMLVDKYEVESYLAWNINVYDIETNSDGIPSFTVNDLVVHNTFVDDCGVPSMQHTVELLSSFEGAVLWYLTDLINPFPFYEMTSKFYRMRFHAHCDANMLFGNKNSYMLHHSLNQQMLWKYFGETFTRCRWKDFPITPVYVPVPYDEPLTDKTEKVNDLVYIGNNYGGRDMAFVKYFMPYANRLKVWGDGWEGFDHIQYMGRTKTYLETCDIYGQSKATVYLSSQIANRLWYVGVRLFEALANGCPVLVPDEYKVSKIVPQQYHYNPEVLEWLLSSGDVAAKFAKMEQSDMQKYCSVQDFVNKVERLVSK